MNTLNPAYTIDESTLNTVDLTIDEKEISKISFDGTFLRIEYVIDPTTGRKGEIMFYTMPNMKSQYAEIAFQIGLDLFELGKTI